MAQLQVQSPVYGVEHEEQVATPDLQEEAMRRLDYSTSGSNIPTQVTPTPFPLPARSFEGDMLAVGRTIAVSDIQTRLML